MKRWRRESRQVEQRERKVCRRVVRPAGLFGLDTLEVTRRQEAELEEAELEEAELEEAELKILFGGDEEGQDEEPAHQRDDAGRTFGRRR